MQRFCLGNTASRCCAACRKARLAREAREAEEKAKKAEVRWLGPVLLSLQPLTHGDSVQEAAKAAEEEAAEEEEGDEGEAEGDAEEGEEPKVPTATSDNRS